MKSSLFCRHACKGYLTYAKPLLSILYKRRYPPTAYFSQLVQCKSHPDSAIPENRLPQAEPEAELPSLDVLQAAIDQEHRLNAKSIVQNAYSMSFIEHQDPYNYVTKLKALLHQYQHYRSGLIIKNYNAEKLKEMIWESYLHCRATPDFLPIKKGTRLHDSVMDHSLVGRVMRVVSQFKCRNKSVEYCATVAHDLTSRGLELNALDRETLILSYKGAKNQSHKALKLFASWLDQGVPLRRQTFDAMVVVLAIDQGPHVAEQIVDDWISQQRYYIPFPSTSDLPLNSPSMIAKLSRYQRIPYQKTITTYCALIEGAATCGHVEYCEQVFDQLNTPSHSADSTMVSIWTSLIRAYITQKRFDSALDVFEKLLKHPTLKPTESMCDIVFSRIFRDRNLLSAVDQMTPQAYYRSRWPGRLLPPTILKENDPLARVLQRATTLFDTLWKEGIYKPSLSLINDTMMFFISRRQYDKVESIYRRFLKIDMHPDPVIVTTLVYSLLLNGRASYAWQLYKVFKTQGVPLDCVFYCMLLNGMISNQQMEHANELAHDIVAKFLPQNDTNQDVYLTLLYLFCRETNMQKAWSLVGEMEKKGLELGLIVYNMLLQGYSRTQNYKAVLRIIDIMKRKGLEPDIYTFNNILMTCIACNKFQDIFKWYKEMLKKGVKPDLQTLSILVRANTESGNLPGAYASIRAVIKEGQVPSYDAFVPILQHLLNHDQEETALQTLELMKEYRIQLPIFVYNLFIVYYGRRGNFKAIESLLKEIQRYKVRPDSSTYRALIASLGRMGHVEKAERWFKDALHHASIIHPDVALFNEMLRLYMLRNAAEKAQWIIDQMKVWDVEPDQETSKYLEQLGEGYSGHAVMDTMESLNKYREFLKGATSQAAVLD